MPQPMYLKPLAEDWERALCVVAHPDDLEYGAASAVSRWTSLGKTVVYTLVSSGEAGIASMPPGKARTVREEEQRRSAAVVGVETVEFLGYADGIIEYGLPLRRDIARAVRRHRPEILVTLNHRLTWGNGSLNMADHRNVGLAVLDAARDAGNGWIFPELLAGGLEPWDGVRMVLFAGSPEPTHGLNVAGHLQNGIASLREHKAYLEGLGGDFDPEAFLRSSAASAGELLGCELAVSFEVVDV